MASNVDEQPPSRPARPRPDAPRRRPPSKAELRAAQRRDAAAPPARRARPSTARRDDDVDTTEFPEPPRSQKKAVVVLSVLTALTVILVGVAIAVSSRDADEGPPAVVADAPVPTTTFRDPEAGISVAYPRAWKRVEVPVAEYRLVVDGGNNVAFTIRVAPIQTPATTANLENFKAFTDGAVRLNTTVTVLKEQAITLNGMLGYYYFYTFADGPVEAVHAHYFLFSGNKMNILVFQTLPDDFEAMASTFDKIAESFRSDPNVPFAAAATTAPSTTTTVK